jgi:hypothetical protein
MGVPALPGARASLSRPPRRGTVSRSLIAGLFAFGVLACGRAESKDVADQGGAAVASATATMLPSGSIVAATIQDAISSRTDTVGQSINATASHDVMNADGDVVIPGGSAIVLTVTKLGPAKNSGQADGAIALEGRSVTVRGTTYDFTGATVGAVPHTLKGRGVTESAVGNVAVGTAIGAIVGQAIDKNKSTTTRGGAVGAAAGGVRAATVADRDVVVAPGAPITITLTHSLKISAK